MKTLDQQRAGTILGQVEAVANMAEKFRQKYGSMSHKLPILVRTAGLVQALAFVEARGEAPHHRLLNDLAATLEYDGGKNQLLERSRKADLSEYMYLTQQTLSALLWYKRFAQSVLDVQTGADDETSQASEEISSEEGVTADASEA